jgi:hypothetical protein
MILKTINALVQMGEAKLAPAAVLVLVVLSCASAQPFTGFGTTYSPTVPQQGGALLNFNCQVKALQCPTYSPTGLGLILGPELNLGM